MNEHAPTHESDLQQVAEFLRSLLASGRDDEAVSLVIELLRAMRDKNAELELRVRKLIREHYGRKREGVSNAQLSLFLEKLGEPTEVKSDLVVDEVDAHDKQVVKEHRRRKPGRRPLPADLERIQHTHQVEGDARKCSTCDEEKGVIGHEVQRVLDFVPAKFVVYEHLLEKLACRRCGDAVVTAKGPGKVISGGIPGAGLLAEVLVNKYRDGLPLYRQVQRFSRVGVDLPRSTLVGWVRHAAKELTPLANLLEARVLKAVVLKTDGTGLDVLDNEHSANIKRGSLYCHVGDDPELFFRYAPDQAKESPQEILAGREGYVVADAGGVYDGLFTRKGSKAIEVGCWMHGRRGFFKAFELGDLRAAIPLKYIKQLYKVEELARQLKADVKRRERLRRSKSAPILEQLRAWIAKTYPNEPPKTPLYKAMGYAINQWDALNRFVEDGRLPIDNGEVERAIRTVAVGRRNYLFAGSDEGAQRAAVIYTIIGSCTLAGVNPWEYLRDVLTNLANGWPHKRIEELLPAAWKMANAARPAALPAASTQQV